jgi:putative heme-binding domain-containing protein
VKDPALPSQLQALVLDRWLGSEAIRGLAAYDDPATPEVLIGAYRSLGISERRDALNALAARSTSARTLLGAVEAGKLARADLTADLVRQLRNLRDAKVDAQIGRLWGQVRATSGDRALKIAEFKALLTRVPAQQPDAALGRAVFAKICQQCHTLFDTGGKVGPDLTGSNRADLDYILSNVLDPSALIGKDYVAHVIATTDGRVLTGLIRAEDKGTITLVTANETVTLPKTEVEARRSSDQSMMAEDLLKSLSEHEIRSLVRYLASPAQVPLPAGAADGKRP